MTDYLHHTFNSNDPELVSVIDELPLWSAPFGLKLLDLVKLNKGIKFLDVGSGLGFPLVELAQRLGASSTGYGLDPWKPAIERTALKARVYGLTNIELAEGIAESIPFADSYFDLIISNNGLNNVENLEKAISECGRVCKQGGQFVFTLNLDESMREFYDAFGTTLANNGLSSEIEQMKAHISQKRPPIDLLKKLVGKSGFEIEKIHYEKFYLKFVDAQSMFNHSFIKYWFLGAWKELAPPELLEKIFSETEKAMDEAANNSEIKLYIPFAAFNCFKI